MLALEQPLLGEEALHSKDNMQQDTTDDADETLSFCDLPLYSVEEWEEDFSSESQGSSSMSSSNHDYFEFFSEELIPTTTAHFPPENIIFCGKLIPYKQPETGKKDSSRKGESIKKQTNIKKTTRGWGIFRWKLSSTTNSNKSTTLKHKKGNHVSSSLHQSPKQTYNDKHGKGYDFPVHKMSILTSSSSGKARWYLFLFGISRFSNEVELRDIKSRQSRRHSSTPPPSPAALRFQNHHNDKISGGKNRSSGIWGLIKVLSCGGHHHPNAMVVSSIACTPQE